ncbi:uncharacterized protein MYCFIDRAFT_194047 [Pseudocercospora fijiensis CIRAD86]|uniref:Uncharacterized protein n=1 Tax=Pseudocercospora fijiensis (strain CIRAD86) TaxID=383855 RepID=M3B925_PSEFD|nr:uncharacterized protein MYCFIDRAFT_194047 [Pseudocercospora fijiensis CIRAD86]EME85832.1 hypothetical protein MYCFIDRAFT_194047 [Pseudocercospora fijiensis CIRAD86]
MAHGSQSKTLKDSIDVFCELLRPYSHHFVSSAFGNGGATLCAVPGVRCIGAGGGRNAVGILHCHAQDSPRLVAHEATVVDTQYTLGRRSSQFALADRLTTKQPWIQAGEVSNCPICDKWFLLKSNQYGSEIPHPKHATPTDKSRWITKNLSKKDKADTWALERFYGYPSSRTKGIAVESRAGPDEYHQWQKKQDECCGYLPAEWKALQEELKALSGQMNPRKRQNRISKKTNRRHAAPGKNIRPAYARTSSVTEMSEAEDLSPAASSKASWTDHAVFGVVAHSDLIPDSMLTTAGSSNMPQYATDHFAYTIPPLEGLDSDELRAQIVLQEAHSESRYFAADDVHYYQGMLSRGVSTPLCQIGKDVLLNIRLVPHLAGGLAPRSSDATIREAILEMGKRQRYETRFANTTAPFTQSASFSAAQSQLIHPEMSRAFRSPIQPNFFRQLIPPPSVTLRNPLLYQQPLHPWDAWNIGSNQ